jgi:hypothetical protein
MFCGVFGVSGREPPKIIFDLFFRAWQDCGDQLRRCGMSRIDVGDLGPVFMVGAICGQICGIASAIMLFHVFFWGADPAPKNWVSWVVFAIITPVIFKIVRWVTERIVIAIGTLLYNLCVRR